MNGIKIIFQKNLKILCLYILCLCLFDIVCLADNKLSHCCCFYPNTVTKNSFSYFLPQQNFMLAYKGGNTHKMLGNFNLNYK